MGEPPVNQLVIATVAGEQAGDVIRTLVAEGFHVTRIDSTSGLLQEATVSLLIGLDRSRLPHLLERIRTLCSPYIRYLPVHLEVTMAEIQPLMIETQVGGATVFVLNVERFEQV
ncbi:MAG: cyclic-di-AMP receptor [Anaerolineae bacterium]|nr:cyclic-di-AMP receptor [Anaerolineae bacterium]MDW8068595.1 cyclic-di-AMP receptor [Anaerolineae bacterium]